MTTESPRWIKSSYSENGGACVEWAPVFASSGVVPVRDSKRVNGPVLLVSPSAFAGLVALARSSEL
ncbi:DUF397 domain-containing protein [Streptomyces albipurpureus]|uniref:DUF397 domain-containing protein n=1 Tax=Streptomyces albipurpureus TaxID=2897419 RepID=A0ABT0UTA5_9ACTN|nr:DUF397 domain-containing protein [Streptomyces sp. CWNU-1]MCM2391828.1 DUF397 domain-containing protein [Streptomyces sp. CWNU-1]